MGAGVGPLLPTAQSQLKYENALEMTISEMNFNGMSMKGNEVGPKRHPPDVMWLSPEMEDCFTSLKSRIFDQISFSDRFGRQGQVKKKFHSSFSAAVSFFLRNAVGSRGGSNQVD